MSADAQPNNLPETPMRGATEAHEIALKRVKAKRDYEGHLVLYVIVNAFLILVWWWSGAGYFWPGWVLAGWGIGIVVRGWETFMRKPITEADVQEEMRRSGL